jgi:hypothetical protein
MSSRPPGEEGNMRGNQLAECKVHNSDFRINAPKIIRIFGQVLFGPEEGEPLLGTLSLLAAGLVIDSKDDHKNFLPSKQ